MSRQIAVIGLGLIGGSIAMGLKEFEDFKRVGVDVSQPTLRYALEQGIVDQVCEDPREALAQAEVQANGYDYAVTAELEDTAFPTKEYDGFSLPAGEYLALRILIGEGAGQNWWCVVFPPLCTAASAGVPETALAAGLTEDQVSLMTEEDGGYQLKFKAVELWERLKAALE